MARAYELLVDDSSFSGGNVICSTTGPARPVADGGPIYFLGPLVGSVVFLTIALLDRRTVRRRVEAGYDWKDRIRLRSAAWPVGVICGVISALVLFWRCVSWLI